MYRYHGNLMVRVTFTRSFDLSDFVIDSFENTLAK